MPVSQTYINRHTKKIGLYFQFKIYFDIWAYPLWMAKSWHSFLLDQFKQPMILFCDSVNQSWKTSFQIRLIARHWNDPRVLFLTMLWYFFMQAMLTLQKILLSVINAGSVLFKTAFRKMEIWKVNDSGLFGQTKCI